MTKEMYRTTSGKESFWGVFLMGVALGGLITIAVMLNL